MAEPLSFHAKFDSISKKIKIRQNLLWPALNIDVSPNAVILLDPLPYVSVQDIADLVSIKGHS
jgi:hypothetical protein